MANYSGFFGQLAAHGALTPGSFWQSAKETHQAFVSRQINGLSDYYRPGIACIPQVEDYNGLSKEPKTYREELQAEIDNWLM